MKKIMFLIIYVCFMSATSIQTDIFNQYVSVQKDSVSLVNLIDTLSKKTKLQFVYNSEKLKEFTVLANFYSVRVDSVLYDINMQLKELSIDSYGNIVVLKRIPQKTLKKKLIEPELTTKIKHDSVDILVSKTEKDTLLRQEESYVETRKKYDNFNYEERAILNNGSVKFSVVPSLSASFGQASENNFALNLFMGETNRLNGFEISSISSVLFKESSGVSVSGVSNKFYRGFKGVQISGFTSLTRSEIQGVQLSGIYNKAEAIKGLQIGGVNNSY